MHQDTYYEHLVVRKMRAADVCMLIIALFGAVLGALIVGGLLPNELFAIVMFGFCFGWYKLYQNTHLEFECIFTNGELDIDRIVYQKRRKRVLSIDVRAFDLLAPMKKEFAEEFNKIRADATLLDYSGSAKSEDRYFASFMKDGKRTLMIFEPSERIANVIAKMIPPTKKRGFQ